MVKIKNANLNKNSIFNCCVKCDCYCGMAVNVMLARRTKMLLYTLLLVRQRRLLRQRRRHRKRKHRFWIRDG